MILEIQKYTLACDADYYLSDYKEIDRDTFLKEMIYEEIFGIGQEGFMLFIGEKKDSISLHIAIIARDKDDAAKQMEYWIRETGRGYEINEAPNISDDYYGIYYLHIEKIPMPVVKMETELS